MRLFLFCLIFVSIITGCVENYICPQGDLSRLIIVYTTNLETKCGLKLDRSSATMDNFGISKICLDFSTNTLMDLCYAREVLVDLIEGFLDEINHHAILRQELSDYPFTAKNLRVLISCPSFYGRYIDRSYIHEIRLDEGYASFYPFDAFCNMPFFSSHGVWHKQEETYEGTVLFVQARREAKLPYTETEMRTGFFQKPASQYFSLQPR